MDKIVDAVEDLQSASKSEMVEAVEELKESLNDLVKRAEGCTEGSKSVVDKFNKWQEHVTIINRVYLEVLGNYHLSHA